MSLSIMDRARVLNEALPYIQQELAEWEKQA